MGEILHLHIGQCGVQLGSAFWEQYMAEHGVEPAGSLSTTKSFEKSENKINKLFYETKEGKYHAISLFIDADSFVIDSLKKGENRKLFNPSNLFCHKEESSGIYARGYYSYNREFHELVTERLRQLSESCESPEGFILTHSLSGGFGSGYGSRLLHELSKDFPKKLKLSYSLFSSPRISNLVVEPYNVILGTRSLDEYTDLSILFDNEALYDICSNQTDKEVPNYADINRMVAQALSICSSSTRFHSSANSILDEIITNLVPYARMHFVIPSYAPFGNRNKNNETPLSIEDLTGLAFNQESVMLSSNLKLDKYVACCVTYRGRVDPEAAVNAVNKLKKLREFKTVDWCPTGFKTGITFQDPVSLKKLTEVGVLINSTAVSGNFKRELQKFDQLARGQAFMHWFIWEGMGAREIFEDRDYVEMLQKDIEQQSQLPQENYDDNEEI